ncbi:hypothetical protein IPM65_00565 [Candidatus Roizmanbacteria bacterium]|nr:MAG: hypothetical protein IPM65_00565 [Candidatus Roizmanbacteria bacterium]
MKTWQMYLLIVVLSFLPLISIFVNPQLPHTSDGAMHAIRFVSYYKEIVEGQFPVRWTGQFHYGYGTTLFNFVYPLPYFVAFPFIAVGMSPVLTLKLSFALTYILAGVGMYLFASRFFKDMRVAFFVTILYQFAPFRLVEMLVRGNLGALYAYAIIPFLFFSIIYFLEKRTYLSWLLITISVSLITLSHTIMGFAFLALSGVFVLINTRKIKEILLTYSAFLKGIAASAFFIIPAILEQKYTNGFLFTKDLFYHHFPSLKALFSPNFTNAESLRVAEVSVQIGLFHVLTLVLAVFLLLRKKYKLETKLMIGFLFIATFGTIVFMQPISEPLWEKITFIRQFQYPWRFVGILTFTTALLGAYVLRDILFLKNRSVFIALSILIIGSTVYYWRPLQGFQSFDRAFYWEYPLTTNYFSEVNTIWMAEEPTDYPAKRTEVIGGEARILSADRKSTMHTYEIEAETPAIVLDRTYFFPGWKVFVDGKETPIQFQDPAYAGMITFQVPEGKHTVVVQFEQSKIQQAGNMISLGTLTVLAAVAVALYRRQRKPIFQKS